LKELNRSYKRIVLKIGSSIFCSDRQLCDRSRFQKISSQISELVGKNGKEVIIVSSGAIALGMNLVHLKNRPKELPLLQACAALGQNVLMDYYRAAFEETSIAMNKKLYCAQVLLTWEDFVDRKRYLNAKNTLGTLLKLGSIPIINENDTISTDEIKFGDNDRLSALVATLVNADLLIILSDVDGLLGRNKELIKVVPEISQEVKALACPTSKRTSVGGMITKIEAAKIAVDSGIPCVIANGRAENIIQSVAQIHTASGNWTLFLPKKGCLGARERWIAFGTKTKGRIMIDEGAHKALLNNKSLLAVGVVSAEGDFNIGDIVSICDRAGVEFARGKAAFSSAKLDKAKGQRFDKEVIHCNNIVLL